LIQDFDSGERENNSGENEKHKYEKGEFKPDALEHGESSKKT
jgi:hypothetical protein